MHDFTGVVFDNLHSMLSCFRRVRLFATPRTVAHQAPLSMGFSRQEYWSGLPCPPPGDVPNPGIESMSLMSPALAGGFFTTSASWEAQSSPPPPLNQVLWASLPEVPSKHDSINMCADDLNSLLSCSLKPTFFSQYDVCFITLHLFRT